MRNSSERPSATSLPASPHDDAHSRSTRYLIMMGIRILCFLLMVVITPYGWYTWVLGAAAIFLPYIAVVTANVSSDVDEVASENPERALPAHASTPPDASPTNVIRIQESPPVDRETPAAREQSAREGDGA